MLIWLQSLQLEALLKLAWIVRMVHCCDLFSVDQGSLLLLTVVFLVAGALPRYHKEGQRTERTSLHDQTVGWRPFLSSSIPIESQLVQTEPPGLAAVSLICAPLSLKPPYPTVAGGF